MITIHNTLEEVFDCVLSRLFCDVQKGEKAEMEAEALWHSISREERILLPKFFKGHWRPVIHDLMNNYEQESPPASPDLAGDNNSPKNKMRLKEKPEHFLVFAFYTPMKFDEESQGEITFCIDTIVLYTRHLISQVAQTIKYKKTITLELVYMAIQMVLDDAYHHQVFHYYSDYQRKRSGQAYNFMFEEALAVAASYTNIADYWRHDYTRLYSAFGNTVSRDNRRGTHFYAFMKRIHFQGYSLPGYCDWENFIDDTDFSEACFEYFANQDMHDLRNCGCRVDARAFWEYRYFDFKYYQISMEYDPNYPRIQTIGDY
jgi:hypothetical protein